LKEISSFQYQQQDKEAIASQMSQANIITQVSQGGPAMANPVTQTDIDMGSLIKLNIRGVPFKITRDDLMNLPESILLCLFPNGVFLDAAGNPITNLTEEDVVFVNFDPGCFEYIVQTFAEASSRLPSHVKHEVYSAYQMPDAEVLNEKPAIIVLREDLDYYVIPPVKGIDAEGFRAVKEAAGKYLVGRDKVFEGLGYSPGKKLGAAEEHLLGMLCSSGLETDTEWGHRSNEPGKTVLTSLALVNLKNPESEQTDEEMSDAASLDPVQSNTSQTQTQRQSRRSRIAELATKTARSVSRNSSGTRKPKQSQSAGTSSKLLLFWRKPARKCWWADDVVELNLPHVAPGQDSLKVRMHIRRVWTLELSVIGVH
jgi:hypothetical protein